MNQKSSDLGAADPDIDTDFHEEHSSEVIVAVRMAQQSQVKLNVLADQKVNISIGITLLFLSLTQSPMVTEVVTDGVSRWGVVLVIILVSASLILALLVVSPRIHRLRIQQPGQMSNPFYFGMFTQIDEDTYVDYMLENLRRDKKAHRMMLVDV